MAQKPGTESRGETQAHPPKLFTPERVTGIQQLNQPWHCVGAHCPEDRRRLLARLSQQAGDPPPDAPQREATLTTREREVLQLLAEGRSTKQTALQLQLSVKTIETHRLQIMKKLGIHSIAGLTKYAIQEGLITLS